MNKYFFILLLLLGVIANMGCGSEKTENVEVQPAKNDFPEKGDLYFKSNDQQEYVILTIDHDDVSGRIYTEEEVAGKVFYSFRGKIFADSILQLEVHYMPESLNEEWIIRIKDDQISLKNSLGRQKILHYTTFGPSEIPDVTEYLSVEDIEKENEAEYLENLQDSMGDEKEAE